MWNVAVVEIGYAAATMLLYSAPVFVSLMAWLIWRELLTRVKTRDGPTKVKEGRHRLQPGRRTGLVSASPADRTG